SRSHTRPFYFHQSSQSESTSVGEESRLPRGCCAQPSELLPQNKEFLPLRQIFAIFWIDSIFICAFATSGRFGKNATMSRYSISACLKAPSAYQASPRQSFARGT